MHARTHVRTHVRGTWYVARTQRSIATGLFFDKWAHQWWYVAYMQRDAPHFIALHRNTMELVRVQYCVHLHVRSHARIARGVVRTLSIFIEIVLFIRVCILHARASHSHVCIGPCVFARAFCMCASVFSYRYGAPVAVCLQLGLVLDITARHVVTWEPCAERDRWI